MRALSIAGLLSFLPGCCVPGNLTQTYRPNLTPATAPVGVVFVANGAGDFRTVSNNLSQVIAENHIPLDIQTFGWSVGYRRYIADQVDHDNHLAQGQLLAAQVYSYHQAYPARRIYFLGHSAGCAVLLAAAELLPPDSVDRMVLLAPSVSQYYDLRPALRAARLGVDVFHSDEDRIILGLGMQIFGTAERASRTAAGRTGFTPVIVCPTDAALYAKLRQHPWHPVVEWSGHDGGHFGSNQTGYLQAYVLPLFSTN